jgi:NAD(P)-dependent dehydrogenase (short-subunit alcohol dehydrogenase family)
MGLATAKVVGRDHTVVLCYVRQDRLDTAAATLKNLGITATAVNCDVTDREAVVRLLETASGLGTVASVIHTAGVSPSMGDADYVMRTNALGTVNVNEVFYGSAAEGSAIVNVASMAAHMLPQEMIPTKQFPLALQDEDAFMKDMMSVCDIVPEDAPVRHRLRGEQELRQVVQHIAGRKVQRSGTPDRLGLPGVHRYRDGPTGGAGRGRRDGHRRRGSAVGHAGRDGRATRLLCQ